MSSSPDDDDKEDWSEPVELVALSLSPILATFIGGGDDILKHQILPLNKVNLNTMDTFSI